MEQLSQKTFMIEDWRISPAEGVVVRADETVRLEPKVMEVLVYLAAHRGEVITREALERDVWHGALVGYDAVTSTVIKLRKALQDDAKHPRIIATIPKKGYQLIANVSGLVVNPHASEGGDDAETVDPANARTPPRLQTKNRRLMLYILSAVCVVIVVISFWWSQTTSHITGIIDKQHASATGNTKTGTQKQPSIVVLPFKNLSDDPQQEYLSDGITDDIITDLSQVGALRVVARQSAYHYKEKMIDLEEIARDLGVRYIVEGSVQKAGQRIRINAQLTDTQSGHHVWAERFDRDLENIFAIQDEISQHVVDAMFVTLSDKENERLLYRNTNNFEAYDTFLIGQQHSRNRSKQGFELARDAYLHAIELDPGYARAYGALAILLTHGYQNQWILTAEEGRTHALELAKKAVELDPSSPQVHWALGYVLLFHKAYQDAETATRQSITISPNYADGYGLLAYIANWRGKAKDAERYIKKAIALNPYHSFDYTWNLGLAYYTMNKYPEAITALQDALQRNETALNPRLYLTACYVRLDRLDDAEWEIEQIKVLRPSATLTRLANILPYENKHQLDSFLLDLKKAGMPE